LSFWVFFWFSFIISTKESRFETMNLYLVLVICFGMLNSQVFGKPGPGLSPPEGTDDFAQHQEMQTCDKLDDICVGCLAVGNCKFALFNNTETKCVDNNLTDAEIGQLQPNATLEDLVLAEDRCPQSGNGDDKPATPIPPKFSTTLTPENETTTTTTEKPTTPATSTSTTTISTSTSTTTESTTPSTTSTEKPTTSATSTSTTTEKTSPVTSTAAPAVSTTPVDPSGKSGSKFDGWSFFGGILLTIGLSAIGFVSFKYYKVRSGGNHASTNYNRF